MVRLEQDNEELHALQNELTTEFLGVQSQNSLLQSQNEELTGPLCSPRPLPSVSCLATPEISFQAGVFFGWSVGVPLLQRGCSR